MRSGERAQERRRAGRGEDDDQERRPPPDQHGGDGERRHAGVEHEPVAVAERLDEDQRRQQRYRDEVERPADPRARARGRRRAPGRPP